MFTITKNNGQVRITKTSGVSISGSQAVITEVDKSVYVAFYGENGFAIAIEEIDTIDGVAPATTTSGVADQIRTLFNSINGGTSGGNPVQTSDPGLGTDGASPPVIAGTGVRGWLRAILEKLSGNVAVTGPLTDTQLRASRVPVDAQTLNATSSNNITGNGGTVTIALGGLGGVGIGISGTWAGTLQFEGSVDGTNFEVIHAIAAGTGVRGTTTTVNGTFMTSGAALQSVRVRATSWTSGTAAIYLLGTDEPRNLLTDVAASASAVAITPADTGSIPATRAIYIGTGGNIVALINGQAITFKNVMSGTILPVSATRVNLTNTTATDLIALY